VSDTQIPQLLATIKSPADLRRIPEAELPQLCSEIREYLVSVIREVGGHFASSLGAVELTVALHYIYDTPQDRIVWDIGHQAYVHKMLTGRCDLLPTIRRYEGMSGFLQRKESEYDTFGAGHSSTAISAALGMAVARDRKGEDHEVVAIVGDGGMTGGLAYEGLNNAGATGTDITVILNDNRHSISPNVGAMSRYLAEIITDPRYNRLREDIWKALGKAPFHETLQSLAKRLDESLKTFVSPGMLFEDLGFKYVGPIDGNNVRDLLPILRKAKSFKKPLLIHVVTRKGCGYEPAEQDPVKWYSVKPAAPKSPAASARRVSTPPAYTEVFGASMLQLAERDDRVMAVTAAMSIGTGLIPFAEKYPKRLFDVGIAEGHAVTFAAGLATEGFRPVCAIYSTFLQRAYDNLFHDVAIQQLPVIFCLDRAGVAGEDGPTHHGLGDLAYLCCIPELVVAAPKDGNELRDLMFTALAYEHGPFAIRYPKDNAWRYDPDERYHPIPIGQWERLSEGSELCILAVGTMVRTALDVAARLAADGISCEIINARFVKPLDDEALDRIASRHRLVVTLEEGVLRGGFGQAVTLALMRRRCDAIVEAMAVEDKFVPHGARAILLDWAGLSVARIEKRIRALLGDASAHARIETSRLRNHAVLMNDTGDRQVE
jgi:1-deoxy-D-xylulose-5-phosphate synthase